MIQIGIYEAKARTSMFPSMDPWLEPAHAPLPQGPAAMKVQLDSFEGYGWFDRAHYAMYRDTEEKALLDLISNLRAGGSEVLLVMMPETSTLRARVPAEEQPFLVDSVQRHFVANSPAILDLRSSMPDDMFIDYAHLNEAGRTEFTLLLARALRNRSIDTGCGLGPSRGPALDIGHN